MATFQKTIPPIKALVVFEVAARLLNFTLAASELGITQGAVSLQIRHLEEAIGFKLFQRLHRRVVLTSEGTVLAAALSESFARIADAVASLKPQSDDDALTVAATVAVSHFWLLPRISGFRADHPNIKLRVLSQDQPIDFAVDDVDVSISYSAAVFTSGKAEPLWREEVFPVCSPAFIERHGTPETLDDLMNVPLISAEARDRSWITWDSWFQRLGGLMPARSVRFRFNHYTDAIYAALAGDGVALGWRYLIGDVLRQGRLVRVSPFQVVPPGSYYVLTPDRLSPRKSATAFVSWLKDLSLKP